MNKIPEKWCIKRNWKNAQAINAWANKKRGGYWFNSESDWLYFDPTSIPPVFVFGGYDWDKEPAMKGFEIISFEKFKKLFIDNGKNKSS